jgi:hypothetical protein
VLVVMVVGPSTARGWSDGSRFTARRVRGHYLIPVIFGQVVARLRVTTSRSALVTPTGTSLITCLRLLG